METENHRHQVTPVNRVPFITILLLLLFFLQPLIFPCTVFYVSDGSSFFGGNNEDWSDDRTLISLIAPSGGRYGWVKFGYKSGFPQGGMNEYGLFWDATAVPYLDMPVSVAVKEKFPGPLMNKVMEECRDVEDAIRVFNHYYCEDQFRAQYLIGDALGNSIIIEGDSHLARNGPYQLITNFYHSFPELGGYPCVRYEKAKSILDNAERTDITLVRDVLGSTCQSGKYPTQYSCIHIPAENRVMLFYNHHFQEYIIIDLNMDIESVNREFDIPDIFSGINPLYPGDSQILQGQNVTFRWTGKRDSSYELIYSSEAGCPENNSTVICVNGNSLFSGCLISFMMLSGVLLTSCKDLKKFIFITGLIVLLSVVLQHCSVSDKTEEGDEYVQFSASVNGLEPQTVYYWKIRGYSGSSGFKSETFVRSFQTE